MSRDKKIKMTVHLQDGTVRPVGSIQGATVMACFTREERKAIQAGEVFLREKDGSKVSHDMEAVDGLALELVSPDVGEGPNAGRVLGAGPNGTLIYPPKKE